MAEPIELSSIVIEPTPEPTVPVIKTASGLESMREIKNVIDQRLEEAGEVSAQRRAEVNYEIKDADPSSHLLSKTEVVAGPLPPVESRAEAIRRAEKILDEGQKAKRENLPEENEQFLLKVREETEKWENFSTNQEQIRRDEAQLAKQAQELANSLQLTHISELEKVLTNKQKELADFRAQNIPSGMLSGEPRIASTEFNREQENLEPDFRHEVTIKEGQWIREAQAKDQEIKRKLAGELAPEIAEEAAREKARANAAEARTKTAEEQLVKLKQKLEEGTKQMQQAIAEDQQRIKELEARTDATEKDAQRLREEAMKLSASKREVGAPAYADEEINEEVIKKFYPEQPSAEEPEKLNEENWRSRLRGFAEGILGVGTGIVTTEGAALGALALFPGLGPVAYLEGSLTGTAAWLTAEVLSTRRNLEARYPRLARFVRNATIGSVATTLANTALTAMEGAGITHFINRPEIPQAAAVNTPPIIDKNVVPPVQTLGQHTVAGGENIWNIVKETHHLKDNHEIARQTVDNVLQNLDVLRADATKFNNTAQLNALKEIHGLTTEQVMKNEGLFRRVMDAGKFIHPGTKLMIK